MFIFFKIKVGRHIRVTAYAKIDVLDLHHRKYIICNTHIMDSFSIKEFCTEVLSLHNFRLL